MQEDNKTCSGKNPTEVCARFLNESVIKLVPSGGNQLEGVAVVPEGDPVGTVDLMGALHSDILWFGDHFFCTTYIHRFLDYFALRYLFLVSVPVPLCSRCGLWQMAPPNSSSHSVAFQKPSVSRYTHAPLVVSEDQRLNTV